MRTFGLLAVFWGISTGLMAQGLGVRLAPDTLCGGLRLLELAANRYGDGKTLWPGDRLLTINGQPVSAQTPQAWRDFLRSEDTTAIRLTFNRFGLTDSLCLRRSVAGKTDWLPYVEPTLIVPDVCGLLASLVATRDRDYGQFVGAEWPLAVGWQQSRIASPACERVLFQVSQRPGLRRKVVEPHIHLASFADSAGAVAAATHFIRSFSTCEPIEGVKLQVNTTASPALSYLLPVRVRPKAAYDEEAKADETLFLLEVRVTPATPETTAIPWPQPAWIVEMVLL